MLVKNHITLEHLNDYITTSPKINPRVLIVDDIERAEIPISQIFGYFSEFIYETDIRLIFIGNEERIPEKENTENDATKRNTDFSLIK